jgi:hypothetical protein
MTQSKSASPSTAMTARLACSHGHAFGSPRRLIVLATAALSLGVAVNWSWLAAAGFSSFVVGALPCAAMCACGLSA